MGAEVETAKVRIVVLDEQGQGPPRFSMATVVSRKTFIT